MTHPPAYVPVVHSVLDPTALRDVIGDQYAVGASERCVLLRSWINEVYRIDTSTGTYILKVFRHAWRTADDLAYEIQLMQHLAASGVRVHPPISTRDGSWMYQVRAPEGPRLMVLYPLLVGAPPLPPSPAVYQRVGRAIAQMHHALDTFVPAHPRRTLDVAYLADESLAWLQPYLRDRPADGLFLAALVARVRNQLADLDRTGQLAWGPIHGDATLDNLLITPDQQIGIYDFDQSGPGWRAYELQGVFAWAWESEHPEFWTALVEGYTSVHPLTATDLAAMPCFPVLNWLWCMGMEAHVLAQNHGQWIVSPDAFDTRLAPLRRWVATHPELQVMR